MKNSLLTGRNFEKNPAERGDPSERRGLLLEFVTSSSVGLKLLSRARWILLDTKDLQPTQPSSHFLCFSLSSLLLLQAPHPAFLSSVTPEISSLSPKNHYPHSISSLPAFVARSISIPFQVFSVNRAQIDDQTGEKISGKMSRRFPISELLLN